MNFHFKPILNSQTEPRINTINPRAPDRKAISGVFFGLGAYLMWGCYPLFFALFHGIPSWEVLIHRVIWSAVFVVAIAILLGRWRPVLDALRQPRLVGRILASALLISANWWLYIYGVETRQILQLSLGYFIMPLVSMALGMVVLRERASRGQGLGMALAALAIGFQLVVLGELPWISLVVALTFGAYGLLRKQVPLDGLSGLLVETLLLMPFGLLALAWLQQAGDSHFLDSPRTTALLMASGVATALPLLAFAGAARRLRLITLGFLMYLNPTIQFSLALLVFGEPLSVVQLITFIIIWVGLALYSWSAWRSYRAVPGSA